MVITRELRRFLTITGVILVVLGLVHLVLGVDLHDVSGNGSASTDSDTRFGGGILIGAGLTWIYSARRPEIPAALVWILVGALGLGALGRIASMLLVGTPGTLGTAQTIIESVAAVATGTLLRLHLRQATTPSPE